MVSGVADWRNLPQISQITPIKKLECDAPGARSVRDAEVRLGASLHLPNLFFSINGHVHSASL
jgi:hypothetical protein